MPVPALTAVFHLCTCAVAVAKTLQLGMMFLAPAVWTICMCGRLACSTLEQKYAVRIHVLTLSYTAAATTTTATAAAATAAATTTTTTTTLNYV
jgi:hypothetical protein